MPIRHGDPTFVSVNVVWFVWNILGFLGEMREMAFFVILPFF
jgi:hypothetical protein